MSDGAVNCSRLLRAPRAFVLAKLALACLSVALSVATLVATLLKNFYHSLFCLAVNLAVKLHRENLRQVSPFGLVIQNRLN